MNARRARRAADTATVYKLCSLALQYPDDELLAARAELALTASGLARSLASEALGRVCDWWVTTPELELAQRYVETFDLHKRSSLYLTFYGLGDADAVIVATGYTTGLAPLVGHLDVLNARQRPTFHGPNANPSTPGLHFVGFTDPFAGNFRQIRLHASALADSLAANHPE